MFDLNRLIWIIIVYIALYFVIIKLKPEIIFENRNNCLRSFGVGYQHTTILPLWLTSILLAIFSYFIVLYFYHARYNCIFIKC
jgi:hypothetical protein